MAVVVVVVVNVVSMVWVADMVSLVMGSVSMVSLAKVGIVHRFVVLSLSLAVRAVGVVRGLPFGRVAFRRVMAMVVRIVMVMAGFFRLVMRFQVGFFRVMFLLMAKIMLRRPGV